jgi:hypothetical protein
VAFLSGLEGAGREKVLRVAAEAWGRKGYQVIAVGKSTKHFAKASIPTVTPGKVLHDANLGLASKLFHDARQLVRAVRGRQTWKHRPVKLTKKSVVLVTDANMPLRQLVELTESCRSAGAKLVLSADPHAPVGRLGMAFHRLAASYQAPTLTASLPKKKDPADREALQSLRQGDTHTAFENFAKRGLLTVSDSREVAKQELFDAWSQRGLRDPKRHLMIASAKDAAELNRRAQESRRRARVLQGFRVRVTRKSLFLGTPRIKERQESFYERDRVQLTSGSAYFNVQAGELATITRIDPVKKQVTLKLDRRLRKVTVPYKKFVPFTLAYALSPKQASNLEAHNAYVLMSGELQNRETTTFLASKARAVTRFFIEKHEAGQPLTELARAAQKSSLKHLGHTVKERSRLQENTLSPEY